VLCLFDRVCKGYVAGSAYAVDVDSSAKVNTKMVFLLPDFLCLFDLVYLTLHCFLP